MLSFRSGNQVPLFLFSENDQLFLTIPDFRPPVRFGFKTAVKMTVGDQSPWSLMNLSVLSPV